MDLTSYRTLGRSGLAVSPLALGTMTFGAGRWGAEEDGSQAIFDAYVGAGGNFIDTADVYSGGESEAMIGRFLKERGGRDRLVIATKSGFPRGEGNPLAGGNSARNIRDGLEGSLRRLGCGHIDMYWTHVWDRTTPPEEVLRALTDAMRRGDILYYGFSNAPAWYAAQVATLARAHGLPQPVGLQYSYSLLDRGVELDLVPAGRALGLGLVAWSPLAFGMLTGKYGRDKLAAFGPAGGVPNKRGEPSGGSDGRLNGDNPYGGMLFTEANFAIVDELRAVAEEVGRPMAQVALVGDEPAGRLFRLARREPTRASPGERRVARHRAVRGSAAAARCGGRAAGAQPVLHLRSASREHLRRRGEKLGRQLKGLRPSRKTVRITLISRLSEVG